METIEQFIQKVQLTCWKKSPYPGELLLQKKIREVVKERGYWRIIEKYPNYRVRMHGPPCEFDQERNYHNHSFFEMVYVYHGSIVNMTPRRDFNLEQGDLMLVNPRALHCPYTLRESDLIFNFFLPIEGFRKHLNLFQDTSSLLYSFLTGYFYEISDIPDCLVFHTEDDPIIRHIVKALILETINTDAPHPFPVFYLLPLFSSLERFYERSQEGAILEAPSIDVMKILTYINQNYRNLSLEDVAQHFGYTPNYLSRYIKQKTGKNFSRLLMQAKLRCACNYLENTRMTLQEICEASGFYDVSNFCKTFKKEFGTTPSSYRKNLIHFSEKT